MYNADARHPDPRLAAKLAALYALRGGPSIDLTIRKPYIDLLAALGDPHKNLPPTIHVAGTNGKGSVLAMLRSIFECAGYCCHVYTSPHLQRFNERIVIASREIDDSRLEDLLDEVTAANAGAPLTFFEITTALAFCAFARSKADICLLETGLGGRLDCTNVIEKPLASVVTRIGFDHMEFLGDTLAKIAAEKAGIFKPGCPAIISPQDSAEALATLQTIARERGCPVIAAAPGADDPPVNLAGQHQNDNRAAALAALSVLREEFDIPDAVVRRGLLQVKWPARLQQIPTPVLPPGTELWIDGGHNESAAQILGAQAALWAAQDSRPLHIALGMMRTKDPRAFITPLLPWVAQIHCLDIEGEPGAFTAAELAGLIAGAAPAGMPVAARGTLADLCNEFGLAGGRLLITGSLYLAGQALRLFQQR